MYVLLTVRFYNQIIYDKDLLGGTPGLGKQEVRLAYVLNLNDINKAMDCLSEAIKIYPGKI